MIAFDAVTNTTRTASGTSHTFLHTCTGTDRFLVVSCRLVSGAIDATCTYNGVAMTQNANQTYGFGGGRLISFTLTNPASGSNNVVISVGTTSMIDGSSVSYTGVSQTGQPEVVTPNSSVGATSVNPSITTITNNSWHISLISQNNRPITITVGTERTTDDSSNYQTIVDSNSPISPAGVSIFTATVTDTSGGWAWIGLSVAPYVLLPPVANFVGSPLSGDTPLTVNFTDQSTGEVTSWAWTFGDEGTSPLQNPSHQYTTAGTFTVTLTVTGPGGDDLKTRTDYITVNPPASPNLTDKNNYNGYLAFIQQYIRHKINGTNPWKNPDGTPI